MKHLILDETKGSSKYNTYISCFFSTVKLYKDTNKLMWNTALEIVLLEKKDARAEAEEAVCELHFMVVN